MPELTGWKPRLWVWIVLAALSAACAGPWHSAPQKLSAPQWSVAPPPGWMHLSTRESEMLSKDGAYLEYILIQTKPLTQGFRFTHQKLNAGMLPHEAAQAITDNMRSDPLIGQFRLLSSEPATIGGHQGFKLIYTYRDQNGVEFKTIYYGVILPNLFFNMRYTATQRYYFDQELPAFNQVFQSLRLFSD